MSTRGQGFSLLELLVVIAIMSIALRFAIPAFQSFLATMGISSRTNDLLVDLSIARQSALTQGTRVVMCASNNAEATIPSCDTSSTATWTEGRIIFADNNANSSFDTGDKLLKVQRADTGAVTINLGGTGFTNTIAFGSNGLRSNLGSQSFAGWAVFTVCQSKFNGRTLWVDGIGRVTASAASANTSYGTTTKPCP